MTWPEAVRKLVQSRAFDGCEYCLLELSDAGFPHEIDHVISRKHGGTSDPGNLALACYLCNRYKGSDIASLRCYARNRRNMGRIHRFSYAGGNSQRARLFVLTLAMVCLSFAVFNWGLQYKMSLYHHSGSGAKASVAKLWTGSKDHNQAASAQPEAAPILIPLLMLTVLVAFRNQRRLTAFLRWQRSAPVWRLQTAPVQNAYFFRPPPSNR